MKQTLYLVRHGETLANAQSKVGDETDPLSEHGHEQTKLIGQRFRTLLIDAIISSPYVRTLATAEAIRTVTDVPLETNDLFVEQRYPTHQIGKSVRDPVVAKERAEIHARMAEADWHLADEENVYDLRARAREALEFLNARTESSLAVVSHGMFIRMLVSVMMSWDVTTDEYRRFRRAFFISNTGLTICTRNSEDTYTGWRIMTWNDHAHLADPDT